MLPPGAAESNRQIAFAFMDVMRQQIHQKIGDALNKFGRLRKRANVFCDLGMASGERAKFGNKMRVGQETHVEDQIGVIRHAMLEPKADAGYQNVCALLLLLKELDDGGS